MASILPPTFENIFLFTIVTYFLRPRLKCFLDTRLKVNGIKYLLTGKKR
jgi:hypothetical protein